MHVYVDYRGNRVRLTEERLAHILEHPEMRGMEPKIAETLARPGPMVPKMGTMEYSLDRDVSSARG